MHASSPSQGREAGTKADGVVIELFGSACRGPSAPSLPLNRSVHPNVALAWEKVSLAQPSTMES